MNKMKFTVTTSEGFIFNGRDYGQIGVFVELVDLGLTNELAEELVLGQMSYTRAEAVSWLNTKFEHQIAYDDLGMYWREKDMDIIPSVLADLAETIDNALDWGTDWGTEGAFLSDRDVRESIYRKFVEIRLPNGTEVSEVEVGDLYEAHLDEKGVDEAFDISDYIDFLTNQLK